MKKTNIVISVIFIILFITFMSTLINPTDNNVKIIKKATKLNRQQSESVFEVLKSVGLNEVHNAKCREYEKTLSCSFDNYDLFGGGILVQISAENGIVKNISKGLDEIYTNGKIVSNLFDHTITKDDFIYLVNNSEEKTKMTLKSPATAIFPKWQEWGASFSKDKVSMSAYVDSQNSFGATIRTPIEFVYNKIKKHDDTFKYTFNSAKIGDIIIK